MNTCVILIFFAELCARTNGWPETAKWKALSPSAVHSKLKPQPETLKHTRPQTLNPDPESIKALECVEFGVPELGFSRS